MPLIHRGAPAPISGRRPVLAVVSDAVYPWHKGGKEMRYWALNAGLARAGFDVHVYTMHWWDGPRDQVTDGVSYHAICRRRELYTGDRRSIVQALVFAVACLRLFGRRFDAIEADHMPYLQLFPLRVVATLKRVPLFVTWHEVWGSAYWQEYLGPAGRVAATLERLAMSLPDHIVAASTDTGRRLVDAGVAKEKVSVLPNGVDLEHLADVEPSAVDVDVVFVGRLLAHKNVDVLLEALALLGANGQRLSCTVVGEGPERDRLVDLARSLGIDSQVHFAGGIDDHADVVALMKAARVVAVPSVREGFGIVVLEALACGTPVVTSDHPDNHSRLLVNERTGVVCPATPAAVAAGIVAASDLAGFSDTDADVGRYTWEHVVAEAARLYTPKGAA